jgi:hypothetical protein
MLLRMLINAAEDPISNGSSVQGRGLHDHSAAIPGGWMD